jgi:hypothetical protein
MSDEESSSSSSSSDDDGKEEMDLAEIKLQQMRRTARQRADNKAGRGNARIGGLQSYEDMQREHGLKRMQQGLRDLLSLHTPPELSSICGVLKLSVKEKASTSIKLIIEYASQGGSMKPERTQDLLNKCWEGACFEYLKTVGHPAMTMFLDPRETIIKIWRDGGLVGNEDFVPHFVAREVKKRYEWVTSPDIEEKLVDLRQIQEKVKVTEKEMLTGSDFNYVLAFLKQMHQLRGLETAARDYVIGELEIARSRIDSQKESQMMIRDDMAEVEEKLVTLTGTISDQLAYSETMAETYMNENIQVETDLQRLTDIMESYIESEEDRAEAGGGTAQASGLRHQDLSRQSIKNLHRKMQMYRNMRDEHDEELRERARDHIDEITRLEKTVRDLEHKLEYGTRERLEHEMYRTEAENDVKFCTKKMLKMSMKAHFNHQESWAFGLRRQAEVSDLSQKQIQLKVILSECMKDKNQIINKIGSHINEIMNTLSPQEMLECNESIKMAAHDDFARRWRKQLKLMEKDTKKKGPKKTIASTGGTKKEKKSEEKAESGDDTSKASKTSKTSKGGKKKAAKKKKK